MEGVGLALAISVVSRGFVCLAASRQGYGMCQNRGGDSLRGCSAVGGYGTNLIR